jgi:CRISPR/Cas system-associated endonuclease Cas1
VEIAREFIHRKLAGQRAAIQAYPELLDTQRALDALDMALSWLTLPEPTPFLSTVDDLRTFAGRAARAYFAAFQRVALRWAKPDLRRIPPHWHTFGQRT